MANRYIHVTTWDDETKAKEALISQAHSLREKNDSSEAFVIMDDMATCQDLIDTGKAHECDISVAKPITQSDGWNVNEEGLI